MPGTTQTETMAPSLKSQSTFFSKVRSRLARRRSNSGEPAGRAAAPTDPYRKARSMDARAPPFASQPALALRAPPRDERGPPSPSPLLAAPPHARSARTSFDYSRRAAQQQQEQARPTSVFPPRPPHENGATTPKAPQENGSATPRPPPENGSAAPTPRQLDGLPAQVDPLRALDTPPRSDSLLRVSIDRRPAALASAASRAAGGAESPTTRRASVRFGGAANGPAEPASPSRIPVREGGGTPAPSPSGSAPAGGLPVPPRHTKTASIVSTASRTTKSPEATPRAPAHDASTTKDHERAERAPSTTPTQHAATEPLRHAPFLELGPMTPLTLLPPSLTRRGSGATSPADAPPSPGALPPAPFPFPRSRIHSVSEAAPGPSVHAIITEEPLPLEFGGAPRLGALPPRARSKLSLTGGARLSPALTMRPPPMPILPLPPLPPPAPPETPRGAAPRPNAHARLRSMPTLSRAGAGAHEDEDADHENAMLEEDEDEHHASSDEETYHSARESISDAPPAPPARTPVLSPRVSRVLSAMVPAPSTAAADPGATTPRASRIMDYFSAKGPERQQTRPPEGPAPAAAAPASPSATPRALPPDFGPTTPVPASATLPLRTPRTPGAFAAPPRTPGALDTPRPGLYHHASRSMVDLLSPKKDRLSALFSSGGDEVAPASRLPAVKGKSELPPTSAGEAPTLRRQHSLPMFSPASPPPPYPAFGPLGGRFRVLPREDEGQERLPPYTNDVHLRAVLPRKLEFTSPGVQARDRKWRRVLCELEGTVFRVYRAPPHISGVSPLTQWWEDKVGVGDIAQHAGSAGAGGGSGGGSGGGAGAGAGAVQDADGRIHIAAAQPAERPSKIGDQPPESAEGTQPAPQGTEEVTIPRARSRSRFGSNILHPHGRSRVNVGGGGGGGGSPGQPAAASRPSLSSERTSSESSASKDELPEPDPKDLIRAYSMQNAESGLGSDYTKRKNVIRVRMEGEQFLLQAPDVATVVDWIEGLQAATNIAPDLDDRPMPRGPLFPRRRRRRPRRPEGATTTNGNANGAATTAATS